MYQPTLHIPTSSVQYSNTPHQSLYIYFTTAALIGLLSGTILHRTSRLLNSIVDLQTPATTKLELVSHKVARKKSWHEESESQNMKLRSLPPSKRDIDRAHREYWESASDKRRGRGNLLARQEVILEEDDSDDIFWIGAVFVARMSGLLEGFRKGGWVRCREFEELRDSARMPNTRPTVQSEIPEFWRIPPGLQCHISISPINGGFLPANG